MILFLNSSPKILESSSFGPKFTDFCFCTKLFYKINSRSPISNVTIFFLKLQPKITQIRYFWSQIQASVIFHEILQLDKFEEADFKYHHSFFRIPVQKYLNHALLVANLRIFVFLHQTLQQDKFDDFKYNNNIFKLHHCANQAFLFPNLRIFILHQALQLNKFEGVNFKYDNSFLEFQPKNIQIKHFWQ